ncbi:DUF262 domain-containing protein [Neptuniibacter sp. QD37_11]|uniref:DUF262 domain-containing protein n=1 Tax=Neptuniibacter sp. QD37_11 TaxID=3398209 RepID=UPI0039F4EF19
MRIPAKIDIGTYRDSDFDYIFHHWEKHQEEIKSGEPLSTDSAERYVCGYPIPSFQRDLCWTLEQEVRFIESCWLSGDVGTFTAHKCDWHSDASAMPFSGWLIDGQQRLTSVERYWCDEFKVFGLYWSELTRLEQIRFKRVKFAHYESSLWDEAKIRNLYNLKAYGGTPHRPEERA